MPIPFTCPHCGHKTDVDDQFVGQSGPCVACGKTVTISSEDYKPPLAKTNAGSVGCVMAALAVVVVMLLFAAVLILRMTVTGSAMPTARQHACSNNLRQMGVAVQQYHDVYGVFPAASYPAQVEATDEAEAVEADETGTDESPDAPNADESESPTEGDMPPHSWRVSIWPYIGYQHLYDQYRFDEPWDSDHNLRIAQMMGSEYQCPEDQHSARFKWVRGYRIPVSNYVMVTGSHTVGEGVEIAQIIDGTANTLMLVEVTGDDCPAWTEPVDLEFDDAVRGINTGAHPGITSRHPGGANAITCDGSIRFLPDTLDPNMLRNMLEYDDGNVVSY